MIASGLTLGASKEALEQGAELQSERVKMSTAGIPAAEIDAALAQSAQEVTQDPSYEYYAKLYAAARGLDAAGANNQSHSSRSTRSRHRCRRLPAPLGEF